MQHLHQHIKEIVDANIPQTILKYSQQLQNDHQNDDEEEEKEAERMNTAEEIRRR